MSRRDPYLLGSLVVIGTFLFAGCRGPTGPAGADASGIDLVPPTVKLLTPWPLDTVYDSLKLDAAAVDNVEVLKVAFTIDGSLTVGGVTLIAAKPPYGFRVDGHGLSAGWHYASVRAADVAGNVSDTPVVPFKLAFSSTLQDTLVREEYSNGVPILVWTMPDAPYAASSYWVRFTPARGCFVRRIAFYLGGTLSDSSAVSMGVWTGAGYPAKVKKEAILSAAQANGDLAWREADFDSLKLADNRDFFAIIAWNARSRNDTLRIALDDGGPPWGRSGSRDDNGWHTLTERYGAENNILAQCDLYYESTADSTGP